MKRVLSRNNISTLSEALQIAIMKMDLMANDELTAFLSYPRHEIVINEYVAQTFHKESIRVLQKDTGDQIIEP